MKTFSFKKYIIIPFVSIEELNKALQEDNVLSVPDHVFAKSTASNACYFIVAEKSSLEYALYASFVFDEDNKKVVQVGISSLIDDDKMLEKVLTKITDYVYNKVGGIYFQIDSDDVAAEILAAAKKAGYKQKKDLENVYVLDKDNEIGIISLISGL